MTQEIKHTPGPWLLPEEPNEYQYGIIALNPTKFVASVTGGANARLIAAAPELLEALVICEDVIARAGGCSSDMRLDAVEKARTAIAKARGEK